MPKGEVYMDRVILVTGVASGMGKATAELLRKRGDRVIGVDIKEEDGIEIIADLSTGDGRAGAVEKIKAVSPGYLDGAITWAGIGNDTEKTIPLDYFGQVEVLKGIRHLLEKSKAPRVVITSSRNSLYPACPQLVKLCLDGREAEAVQLVKCLKSIFTEMDDPNSRPAYIAAKTASTLWMRRNCVLPEWGGKGILINAIAPGLINTPMTQPVMGAGPVWDWLLEEHPQAISAVKRLLQPEEAAQLSAYLLSPEQSILIGQILYMDYGTEVILRGEKVFLPQW
jgi:NAD(P)-dependent dehydrogenase (short-subunit alcohol dehydrogenase family)